MKEHTIEVDTVLLKAVALQKLILKILKCFKERVNINVIFARIDYNSRGPFNRNDG